MDLGSVISLIVACISLAGLIIVAFTGRKTGKEANETDRFEALLGGYEKRIDNLEKRVNELETKNDALEAQNVAQASEMRRLKHVVKVWFEAVSDAWKRLLPDQPMPLPSEEELELLEITVQR